MMSQVVMVSLEDLVPINHIYDGKRENPRFQSWDESVFFFFCFLTTYALQCRHEICKSCI